MLKNPGDSHASVRYFFGMTWFFDSLKSASLEALFLRIRIYGLKKGGSRGRMGTTEVLL